MAGRSRPKRAKVRGKQPKGESGADCRISRARGSEALIATATPECLAR